MLSDAGIIPALAPWLKFERATVLLPILHCFSTLVMDNEVLATRVSESKSSYILIFKINCMLNFLSKLYRLIFCHRFPLKIADTLSAARG